MHLRFAFGFLPVLLQYTDDIKPPHHGMTKALWVRILLAFVDDIGLHQHEFVHVAQWYFWLAVCLIVGVIAGYWWAGLAVGLCLHPLLYTVSRPYRLRCELMAYREQLKHYPGDNETQRLGREELFAWFIADRYGLDIFQVDALRMLRD